MMRFNKRIFQLEIMDEEDLSMPALKLAYQDINRSNRLLGGYRATAESLLRLCSEKAAPQISLIDVGCGEGAMLRFLADQLRKKGYNFKFYGLDLSDKAIELAKIKSQGYPELEFFKGDILDPQLELPECNYVISTLTMHHFRDNEIEAFIRHCVNYASTALIINDLQRSKLAYYLFKCFSAIFIRSSIAKNDGLLSIRKGFIKKELESIARNFDDFTHLIEWKWAFRYVWVLRR